MDALLQDVRYAMRALVKNASFTATVVLTLALGIGANAAIFSVVYAVLLRPLPYENPHELVRFLDVQHGNLLNNSLPNVYDWRRTSQSFSAMAVYNPFGGFTLTDGSGATENVSSGYSEGAIFRLLGVRMAAGRNFSSDEEKRGGTPVVIIGHNFWQRKFGGQAYIVGQAITLNTAKYTVVGVLPPSFQLFNKDVWVPLGPYVRPLWLDRGNHGGFQTLGRLRDGVTLEQGQAEMDQIALHLEKEYPAENRDLRMRLTPLQESQVGHLRGTMNLLLGAVSLVLLIACVNVASLALARNVSREREVAIREALGATPPQLIRLFLCESLLLATFGGVAGTLLAMWSADAMTAFWHPPASVGEIRVEGAVLAYAAGMTLLTGILFGTLPAWQASRTRIEAVLRQQSGVGGTLQKQRMRRALVAIEVALCLALLAGAGAMVRTFYKLSQVDPGFRAESLLAVQISEPPGLPREQLPAFNQQLREELRNVPGVTSVAYGWPFSYLSFSWTPKINFHENPVRDGEERMVETSAVTPEYFSTMGVPLKLGRLLDRNDRAGTRIVAVVSEEFVRAYWPGQNPLGRRLRMIGIPDLQDLEVVGVVGNTLRGGAAAKTYSEIYCAFDQFPTSGGTLVVRTAGDPALAMEPLRTQLKKVNAQIAVVRSQTVSSAMASALADRQLVRLILGLFAAVALALAAVGIYGVVAFSVAQRTREIGLRVALGAGGRSIQRLVVMHGIAPVLAGVLAGLGAAAWMAGYLKAMVYGVQPFDPASLAAAGAVLLLAGLLACWLPARRAARIDPTVALRYE